MKFTYDVPTHLIPHIEHCSESELNRVITTMLELSVRHQLIYFPDTSIERDITSLKGDIRDIKTAVNINDKSLKTLLSEIMSQLNKLENLCNQNSNIRETKVETFDNININISNITDNDSQDIDVNKLLDDFMDIL